MQQETKTNLLRSTLSRYFHLLENVGEEEDEEVDKH